MVLACLLLLAVPAAAQQAEVHIQRVAVPPTIDGAVSPEEWKDATRIDRWYEVKPGDNTEPKVRTVGFLGYDAHFLYVAFINDDPNPKAIRAPYADRDNIDGGTDLLAALLGGQRTDVGDHPLPQLSAGPALPNHADRIV
ncbi:MAG TPA: hypothetical protein VKH35_15160 [Thermoanaerobaculia bacterium]|nr:hypothetical protein [Thermoanaerobaculia bacterium]